MRQLNLFPAASRALRSLAGTALALPLFAGCATQIVDVHAEDTGVLSTDLRVGWQPGAEEPAVDAGAEPPTERAGPRVSIEFDLTQSQHAEDQLSLPSGQGLLLGGTLFTGSDITALFDITRMMLDARIASPSRRGFSIEGFVGFEYTSMNLQISDGGLFSGKSASSDISSLGPAVGAALIWQPLHWLRCSTEGRVSAGLSSQASGVAQSSFDVGVGLYPWQSVGAYLGWRSQSYGASDSDYFSSDVNLKLSGPVLGLRIGF